MPIALGVDVQVAEKLRLYTRAMGFRGSTNLTNYHWYVPVFVNTVLLVLDTDIRILLYSSLLIEIVKILFVIVRI